MSNLERFERDFMLVREAISGYSELGRIINEKDWEFDELYQELDGRKKNDKDLWFEVVYGNVATTVFKEKDKYVLGLINVLDYDGNETRFKDLCIEGLKTLRRTLIATLRNEEKKEAEGKTKNNRFKDLKEVVKAVIEILSETDEVTIDAAFQELEGGIIATHIHIKKGASDE